MKIKPVDALSIVGVLIALVALVPENTVLATIPIVVGCFLLVCSVQSRAEWKVGIRSLVSIAITALSAIYGVALVSHNTKDKNC